MPRIPYPAFETMNPDVRAMVEPSSLNPLRIYAHCTPAALLNFVGFTSTFFTSSTLPADLRQVAILRVACICNSTYVRLQHEALCREVGMSEAMIAAIEEDEADHDVLTPSQRSTLNFANDFIVGKVTSDSILNDIRTHLNDQQLMDLMMVMGSYMLMARIIETTGVELDNQTLSTSLIANNFSSHA